MSGANSAVFHLLSGEYPPRLGGVGDYTALLAAGLAAAGAEVHVWTSPVTHPPQFPGVTVHDDGGTWSPADLARLGHALDAFGTPRRLVVQHSPNAWGYKGLNVGFCRWLLGRRRRQGDEIRLMFHEVAYPWLHRDRPSRWLLAAGQRWMARILLKASTHVDVTTPAWETMLRACAPADRRAFGWRPVPSNIPVSPDTAAAATIRSRVAPSGEAVVGSFSAFAGVIGPRLAGLLPRVLLDQHGRVGLLIGHGSDRFAERMIAQHPGLAGRLVATGALAPEQISTHLRACDLVMQPYLEGITTRRGSAMAALSHGVPMVTNFGHLAEPFWSESGAVMLAATPDAIPEAVNHILADSDLRARIGAAGRALYERRFAVERTVEALLLDVTPSSQGPF